jgi:hypothetical protein
MHPNRNCQKNVDNKSILKITNLADSFRDGWMKTQRLVNDGIEEGNVLGQLIPCRIRVEKFLAQLIS